MSGGEDIVRPDPLTVDERIELIERAIDSDAGRAVQGAFLASMALGETGADAETICAGRNEAPDSGIAMYQAILDERAAA